MYKDPTGKKVGLFQRSDIKEQIEKGDSFVSEKGDIFKGAKRVCCTEVKNDVCTKTKGGYGHEYGGLRKGKKSV